MSNYFSKAKRPKGKKFEDVWMLDDYYGRHRYGVKFLDGAVFKEDECTFMKNKPTKEYRTEIKCFNCGRWNKWDKPLQPDCECGNTKYTGEDKPTKEPQEETYQTLENKALEEFDKDYYRLEWHTPEEIKDFLKSHLQLAYKAGEEKERENRWSGISPNVLENILNDTRKKAIDDYNKRIKKWVEKN